jgi:hypothetical protein
MSWEQDIKSISRTAAVDLSALRNRFVSQNNLGQVQPTAAGAKALGVNRTNPLAGNICTVAYAGVLKVQVGATAVTAGDQVAAAAGGLAVTAATGNVINGEALDSGNPGDVIPVLLFTGGKA